MKLIVCLDERNGMSFAGRRQSRDSAVCGKILQLTAGAVLWMNKYSAKLFSGKTAQFRITDSFLEGAREDDFCFAENVDVSAYLQQVKQLIVFRWNRHYPADLQFPGIEKWNLISTSDFPGNSHDLITMEVYIR